MTAAICKWALVLAAATAFGGDAFADDIDARAKLVGSWQAQDSGDAGVWTVASNGATLRVTHSVGDQKLLEVECATTGSECDAKDAGKPAKVSLWFNGAKLVELETKGKEVVKRRFAVDGQGDGLELEVIPIAPDGKSETLKFRRVH